MASKKKNLTTIDERTRSQNSRYEPFHHLEPRQGRTVLVVYWSIVVVAIDALLCVYSMLLRLYRSPVAAGGF